MAEQAKITSLDVLETFRAQVIVFLTKARRALDQAGEESRCTRQWLEVEQRVHWEGQLRRRNKVLDRVTQELITARFSSFRDSLMAEESAVRKAKAAVAEAEGKLKAIKYWLREFDRQTEPLLKRLEMLRQYLDHEMPMGVAFLVQAQKTLADYAGLASGLATSVLPPVITDLPSSTPESPTT